MTIWNGITEQGAVVPIQVDAQGRVVVSNGGGAPSEVYGTAKAVGSFSSNGTQLFAYMCSGSQQTTGLYNITFATPRSDESYSVLITPNNAGPYFATVSGISVTGFSVRTFLPNGDSANVAFNFAVFDPLPSDVTPLILPTSTVNEVKALRSEVDKLKKDKNP